MTLLSMEFGRGRALRLAVGAIACAVMLSGCSGGFGLADINPFTKFSSSKYGKASPRVTSSRNVPKGGGRAMVGKPYQVAGKWYTPQLDENYDRTGLASWYGPNFHGRLTANGEVFDQYALSAAHPTMPLPSYARVTNMENGQSVIVRVNDRGPYAHGRVIDLSRKSAELLDFQNDGTANVRVQYVGPAPLEGDDTRILMASYNAPSMLEQGRDGFGFAYADATPSAPVPLSRAGAAIGSAILTPPADVLAYAPANLGPVPADIVSSAFAATENMAMGSDLAAWQQSIDADAREVSVQIGVFGNPDAVERVALAFAALGAIDETPVTVNGQSATALTLSWLKPGVGKQDVLRLSSELGLEDVAFER